MDDDAEQQAGRVDRDVALAALDLFTRVVAPRPPLCDGGGVCWRPDSSSANELSGLTDPVPPRTLQAEKKREGGRPSLKSERLHGREARTTRKDHEDATVGPICGD
jgi:hypothetical protein